MPSRKNLDDLADRLATIARDASTLDEQKLALDALKTAAEATVALNSDTQHQLEYRLERLKLWPSVLVPIVSLLTLFATVWVWRLQDDAARKATENTEWRALLTSLENPQGTVLTDVTIEPRLKSFSESSTYGPQARAIAIRLMSQYANASAFRDMFSYVFDKVTPANFSDVWQVTSGLKATKGGVEEKCSQVPAAQDYEDTRRLSYCGADLSDDDLERLESDYRTKASGSDAAIAFLDQIPPNRLALVALSHEDEFVSSKISDFIRHRHLTEMGVPSLENGLISYSDLSDTDFSNVNLSGTVFDSIDLSGANLNTDKFSGIEFRASNWWSASVISKKLLEYAAGSWNPHYSPNVTFPIQAPVYAASLRALCHRSNIPCPPQVPFGPNGETIRVN